MNKKTESEELFEYFCKLNNIKCVSIPTASLSGEPTADYECTISDAKFFVEVKEVRLSDKVRLALQEVKAAEYNDVPGGRVRSKISKAAPQLNNLSNGKYPSLLVLYNKSVFTVLDEYQIRVGMYGLQTLELTNLEEIYKKPQQLNEKFGTKKKMTKNHNTTISAVAVISADVNGLPSLIIYHNYYAKHPLNERFLKNMKISQYKMSSVLQFQEWEKIDE